MENRTRKQIDRDKKYVRLIAAYQELDAEYQRTEGKKSRAVMVWRKLENRFGYSEIHIKRVLAANGIDYRTSIETVPQCTKQLTDNEH